MLVKYRPRREIQAPAPYPQQLVLPMFRTHNDHETPAFAFIHGAGIRMWRTVGLELHIPYFLVVRAYKVNGAWCQDSYLLGRDADLVGVCEEAASNDDIKILRLSILLPDDTTAGWQMEEVFEVWSDSNRKNARPPILVGLEGQLLSSQKLVRPFSNKMRRRVYFKESSH